jgi:hypothetical protein
MRTTLQIDHQTSRKLKILAKYENRTKADEIRFLVKKELERLSISNHKSAKFNCVEIRN